MTCQIASYTPNPRMYADDTHLTFVSNNIDDISSNLNHQDLANVIEWLIANRLTLHQSKTEFMLIGSRQRISTFHSAPTLTIDGVPLEQVSHPKSLGVQIDENLSWNEHINKLSKKIASCIGALKRIQKLGWKKLEKLLWSINRLGTCVLYLLIVAA